MNLKDRIGREMSTSEYQHIQLFMVLSSSAILHKCTNYSTWLWKIYYQANWCWVIWKMLCFLKLFSIASFYVNVEAGMPGLHSFCSCLYLPSRWLCWPFAHRILFHKPSSPIFFPWSLYELPCTCAGASRGITQTKRGCSGTAGPRDMFPLLIILCC